MAAGVAGVMVGAGVVSDGKAVAVVELMPLAVELTNKIAR